MDRVTAGERLSSDELYELAATPDVLPLGMLADAVRRRLHGARVTYVRVAACGLDQPFADSVPPGAGEVRVTGSPGSLDAAVGAIAAARQPASGRTLAAFSWAAVEELAERSHDHLTEVLDRLRDAGLDAIAELALDTASDPAVAIDRLTRAGFQQLRLTIDRAPGADRVGLFLRASALQEQFACIQTLNPLPMTLPAFRPTTGYEDVKMVAIARLAAPNIPSIQVDWPRYGPKLAQVALTFGADDVYGIAPGDEAPEGRRRAPVEEIRRNIEAAGFEPAERDGRFTVVA